MSEKISQSPKEPEMTQKTEDIVTVLVYVVLVGILTVMFILRGCS